MGRKLQGAEPGGFGLCLSGPPGCYGHYVSPKFPSTCSSSPSKQLLPSPAPCLSSLWSPSHCLFRFPCCLLVQRHPSLLPSSIPSAETLRSSLRYGVSPILLATDGDSDNESNMKGVRAHLVKRITSCQGGMDGKELLRRVTRGPFGGSDWDLGPQ